MKKIFVSLALMVASLIGVGVATQPVWADAPLCNEISDPALLEAAGCTLGGDDTVDKAANNIIQVVLSLMGVLAVCVMILGGIMYIISTGDAAKVHRAKNLIMYGLIGLVVSLLAYAIVQFVIQVVAG